MTKLQALRGQVVIVADKSEAATKLEAAGIALPSNVRETAKGRGTVVSVGLDLFQNGVQIPTCLKVGDKVVFESYSEAREIDGEHYHLLPESSVNAIVTTE